MEEHSKWMKWTHGALNCSCATFVISAFGSPKCLKTARRRHSLRFEKSSTSCSEISRNKNCQHFYSCKFTSRIIKSFNDIQCIPGTACNSCSAISIVALLLFDAPALACINCLSQSKSPGSDTYPRKLRLLRWDAMHFAPIKALKEKKLKKKSQLFEQKKKIQQKVQRSHLATENSLAVKNITHNAGFPSLPALPLSW